VTPAARGAAGSLFQPLSSGYPVYNHPLMLDSRSSLTSAEVEITFGGIKSSTISLKKRNAFQVALSVLCVVLQSSRLYIVKAGYRPSNL